MQREKQPVLDHCWYAPTFRLRRPPPSLPPSLPPTNPENHTFLDLCSVLVSGVLTLDKKVAAQSILERERERQAAEANRSREERQQAAEQEAARQAEDKRR